MTPGTIVPGRTDRRAMSNPASSNLTRRATFTSAMMIALCTALLGWNLLTAQNGRYANGVGVGADYLAFYNAGDILNRFGPSRLYDQKLQYDLYHERLPGEPSEASLPFANGPQVAVAFRALATLPYPTSYVLWTILSACVYVAGVLAFCAAAGLKGRHTGVALLLACAFEPFLVETLHGGQISSVAFALFGLGCLLVTRGLPMSAGFVFGTCCYKPTLLVVLIPALMVTRRWKELAGCSLAILFWAGVCVGVVGVQPCLDHLNLLTHYATDAGATDGAFRAWKFVDLNTFLTLAGASKLVARAVCVVSLGLVLYKLRTTSDGYNVDHDRIFLAMVLAWTPLLNGYAGAYDAVLVAGSALLACGVLLRRDGRLPVTVVWTLIFVALSPWITAHVARGIGVQVFTLALLAWGLAVVRLPLITRREQLAGAGSLEPTLAA